MTCVLFSKQNKLEVKFRTKKIPQYVKIFDSHVVVKFREKKKKEKKNLRQKAKCGSMHL